MSGGRRASRLLTEAIREAGAYGGSLYVMDPAASLLRMLLISGIPQELCTPWHTVPLHYQVPVPMAARERRQVWQAVQGSDGQPVARFHDGSVTIPYPFAVLAVPIFGADDQREEQEDGQGNGLGDGHGDGPGDGEVLGVLSLLWDGCHARTVAPAEAATGAATARRLAPLVRRVVRSGAASSAGTPVDVLPPRDRRPGRSEAMAAADFTELMPEGACTLDLTGRVLHMNAAAARLLGASPAQLLGRRPREVLPWLDDPTAEDRYRTALFGRQPVAFTIRRPTGQALTFEVRPGERVMNVRITPAGTMDEQATLPASPVPPSARGGALYRLTQLAAALAQAVGVGDVIDTLAVHSLPVFGAQAVAVFSAESGRLTLLGTHGYPPGALDQYDNLPLSSGTPSARALADRVPLFSSSPDELRRHAPGIEPDPSRQAWAHLPLIISDRAIGGLVLAYDQPHPFPPDERAVLLSLSSVVAQAFDRARLYDTQHQLVRSLQSALLPRSLPAVPGLETAFRYRAATEGVEIGGDFFDLVPLDDGSTVAVIGDVQGHNVNAAALMGQVRTAVRATANTAPDTVLSQVNRLLTDLDPGLFTSCLYAHYDPVTSVVRLASAGHPPPLLRDPAGGTTVVPVPPGLLLGIDAKADFTVTDVPLLPGSVLVLYTDGLVETRGEDLDFSTLRLSELLEDHGAEHLDALADALLRATSPAERLADDVALLLLKVTV
ncbi:SpoIIE family protein phosphatase [Streptomyces sp. NBC_01476]|uniref:SpoIIE family protein phosphatase n=1 Tax=Streptomyces sp. NBC_01476 TaxID=2903881 RepID=UPI002E3415A3|nr:SpoIIE family protein phosphatase [Streptomyces sp. NBC_01476]